VTSALAPFDAIALPAIVAYLLLWLIVVAAAPRKDLAGGGMANMATILAGTLLAYASTSIWVFVIGWALTVVPSFRGSFGAPLAARICLAAGTAALAAGAVLMQFPQTGTIAIGLFLIAILLRKGAFPVSFWVVSAFESASLPALGLLFNSHLGGYLLIRFAVPQLRGSASQALFTVAIFTLFTSLYAAVRALAEQQPRRILGLLCVSQASFILAGLDSNVEGATGALVHWWVVAFATAGLIAVYRALEVRTPDVKCPREYLGLGIPAPRLAVFFAICALALVGLPGTLGFAAQDLLFHGALESHPLLGVALPVATALNAITVLRLFAKLFLGRRANHVAPIPDARIRERWALSAAVIFLVAGGLAPGAWIALRAPAAEWIASLLTAK
jgi:NADH-quinone oxidoreductase subunit M